MKNYENCAKLRGRLEEVKNMNERNIIFEDKLENKKRI